MTLHLNPAHIAAGDFGCLEPAQEDWLDQRDYWEDFNARFFRSNGRAYDSARDSNVTAWLTAPDRAPYAAMAERLLEDLSGRVDLAGIDLVLMAHWLPDLHLGTSVTNFVQNRLEIESGLGFAISDRGPSAPLFALDLAARYLRDGRRRALVLAMDQKHLLYRTPELDRLRPRNSAAALLLEAGGAEPADPGLVYAGYARSIGLAPADLSRYLSGLCAAQGLAREAVTVIADPAVTRLAAPEGPVIACEDGWLCAGPLAGLARHAGQRGHVLLATFEQGEVVTVLLRDPTLSAEARP